MNSATVTIGTTQHFAHPVRATKRRVLCGRLFVTPSYRQRGFSSPRLVSTAWVHELGMSVMPDVVSLSRIDELKNLAAFDGTRTLEPPSQEPSTGSVCVTSILVVPLFLAFPPISPMHSLPVVLLALPISFWSLLKNSYYKRDVTMCCALIKYGGRRYSFTLRPLYFEKGPQRTIS